MIKSLTSTIGRRLAMATRTLITDTQTSLKPAMVDVQYDDNSVATYPHIYLRDNCQCAECADTICKERLVRTSRDIDLHIKAEKIELTKSRDAITCHWPDGHQSTFHENWLKERVLNNSTRSNYRLGHRAVLWDRTLVLPTVEYDDLMNDDEALLEHIDNLMTYGLSCVRGAPKKPGQLHHLARRCGLYLRKTAYGETFQVKTKESANNLAYTSGELLLHVDQPYLMNQPGLQMLHCIEQSEDGGMNLLSDGFKSAEDIRRENPEMYKMLTQTMFKFKNVVSDTYGETWSESEKPIFELDRHGRMEGISLNHMARSSYLALTPSRCFEAYEALFKLDECLYRAENLFQYKMDEGNVMFFNNKRVLHGRTAYDSTKSNRWLEGGYLDWDEVLGKHRVVSDRIAKQAI